MKYIGDLYGKVAGKYIPLSQTSADIDKLESERDELLAALKEMIQAYGDDDADWSNTETNDKTRSVIAKIEASK